MGTRGPDGQGHAGLDGQGPVGGAGSPGSLSDRARPGRNRWSGKDLGNFGLSGDFGGLESTCQVSVKLRSSAQTGPRGPVAGLAGRMGVAGRGCTPLPVRRSRGHGGTYPTDPNGPGTARAGGGTHPRPRDRGGRGPWRTGPARGERLPTLETSSLAVGSRSKRQSSSESPPTAASLPAATRGAARHNRKQQTRSSTSLRKPTAPTTARHSTPPPSPTTEPVRHKEAARPPAPGGPARPHIAAPSTSLKYRIPTGRQR